MTLPVPWRLLTLAVVIVSLGTQPVFLLGAGYVQIGREFGFSATGLGVITSTFWLTAAAVSPLAGRVVQRIGWRRAMKVNALGAIVVLIAIAVGARSTITLALLLMASAVMYGFANPSANLALAESVDPHRRALTFGLKHAGIPFSTMLAGLAVPLLIVSFGWRWAFVAATALGVVVLALVPSRQTPQDSVKRVEDPRRALVPLTRKRLITMAVGISLAAWAATALTTYLVAAATETGYSESAAGFLLFGGSIASIAGRVSAGHLTDKLGSRGFVGIATMAATGAVAFALLTMTSGTLFAALVLVAFATGWGWPGLMTYAVVNANLGSVAASSAIPQAGVFVGAATAPLVLGWVADTWSFNATWGVVAVALTLSAVIITRVGRSAIAAR